MIAVHTELPAYRAAAAELPQSVRIAASPRGTIAVVAARAGAAAAALDAGAIAVVVCDPTPEAVAGLPRDAPVVLDRALLRADAQVHADPHAALLTAECAAAPADLDAVVVDAVGWLRTLAVEAGPWPRRRRARRSAVRWRC
ncbi:hypothetical protein [Microbacterium sp.]|uniref:hypothetical protein n=1 Tax=Microbacterium sp. TaxID=51671 RepID=UPI0039E39BD2